MSTSNRIRTAVLGLLTLVSAGAGLALPAILALAVLTALVPFADALQRDPAPPTRHEPA
ncbi:hypothetical protein [Micromonospora sp. C32]|uniref:hypothetical protein n=1 Tax=unclassified Micromonospora TaxID=2617518 RepID=UPI001B37AB50|nr:hypothetical protein [Micromonospora sp. C32]MBQ1056479.1 hypothetical protein [Micromonospora sp. C32]